MARNKKLPVFLTADEQKALLGAVNRRWPTSDRHYVMMRLCLNTGLRLSEVLNLRWVDIDLQSGELWVRNGKGGKDRRLYIPQSESNDVLQMMRDWRCRQKRDFVGGETAELCFTTLKKETPVGPSGFRRAVKKYAKRAGIEKNVSPHTLRHSFATFLYKKTKNLRVVQQSLGHSHLQTTEVYLHLADDEIENELSNFSISAS